MRQRQARTHPFDARPCGLRFAAASVRVGQARPVTHSKAVLTNSDGECHAPSLRQWYRTYSMFKGILVTQEHHLFHASGKSRVDQGMVQEPALADQHGYPLELGALALVHANSVCQFDAVQQLCRCE